MQCYVRGGVLGDVTCNAMLEGVCQVMPHANNHSHCTVNGRKLGPIYSNSTI